MSGEILTVRGDPPGSEGCAARGSKASKAPIAPAPASPTLDKRVRVIVHPALFWSVFDATSRTCTASAEALSSKETRSSPLKNLRQLCVKQNSG